MIDMKKNDEKGFTLVEILIAIVVLAIGVLAMGQMQIASIRGNSIANTLTEATTLAQDRMENLIGLFYTDPLNNDSDADGNRPVQDGDNNGIDDDDEGTFVDGINNFGLDDNPLDNTSPAAADHSDPNNPVDGRYNIFWNIALDYPVNNTKKIRVIVTWTDKGAQRRVSITSMKADII